MNTDIEKRLEHLEDGMRQMQKAVERMADALEKLVEVRVGHNIHSQEIAGLRKASHEHGNRLQELDAMRQRVCKLETHEELREDELKASFSKRDDRINNLSRIVYIGTGIVIVLQVVLPIFVFRG